jgi:hypothetical protein
MTFVSDFVPGNLDLRDVNVMGSNDKSSWENIKEETALEKPATTKLQPEKKMYTMNLKLQSSDYFRYIKLQYKQKSPLSYVHYVSGIELYGHLI